MAVTLTSDFVALRVDSVAELALILGNNEVVGWIDLRRAVRKSGHQNSQLSVLNHLSTEEKNGARFLRVGLGSARTMSSFVHQLDQNGGERIPDAGDTSSGGMESQVDGLASGNTDVEWVHLHGERQDSVCGVDVEVVVDGCAAGQIIYS